MTPFASKPPRFAVRSALALLLLCLLAACSSSSPAAARPTRTVLKEVVGTRPAAASLLAKMVDAYRQSDWGLIRNSFSNEAVGQKLVRLMLQWKDDQVDHLHAKIVRLVQAPGNHEIATIQFYQDPRAIPSYAIYELGLSGSETRVVDAVTGVRGSSYANANWSTTRSTHFVFYHGPYQLEGTDRSMIGDLEFERREFIRKFHLNVAPRINYYLYPQQSLMGPMTRGACGTNPDEVGCADPFGRLPSIHTVEWPSYHEPIHIFQRSLEPKVKPNAQDVYVAPLFIAEGMAVALEDRTLDPRLSDYCSDLVYIPLDTCARDALGRTKPTDLLTDDGFKQADPGHAYALGGSFVKFLILKYGYRVFGRFYYVLAAQPGDQAKDYLVATEKVFHTSIQHLLKVWQSGLASS